MGPTTKAISVTGGITFGELRKNFYDQARGLIEGGADLLLFETCQDTRNIKAGMLAIDDLSRELGQPLPVMISVTIEPMGTMLARPERRSAVGLARPPRTPFPRPELRHRTGVHDGPHSHVAIADESVCLVLSECGTAQ